jgi:hypothetical protein
MKIEIKSINCQTISDYSNSKREKEFRLAVITLNYHSEDKNLIDRLIDSGNRLAKQVNSAAANMSSNTRSSERIINNSVAGILAEYCWKKFINTRANDNIVDYTEFNGAATQIDLKTLKSNKLIEVRSSFPRNGLEFAICHPVFEFDILGPYSNQVKPAEIQKDFYTRTLFHIPKGKTFMELLTGENFKVYLTGGATWDMMIDNNVSKNKHLLPEDSIGASEQQESLYRVVPFSKAKDTIEIYELILSA